MKQSLDLIDHIFFFKYVSNLSQNRFAKCTATKILFMYFQKGIAQPQSKSNFHIHVSVSHYIFPGSVHIFSCSRTGGPVVGIFESLTDTWMCKLGLRPSNSFSGNIRFKFSVLFLCSLLLLAVTKNSKRTILYCRKEILRILPLRKKEPRVVAGVELVPLNQHQLQVSQWSLHTQLLSTRASATSAQYSPPRGLPEAEQAIRKPEHPGDLSKPDEETSSH